MSNNAAFVNNFTISAQNMNVILDAKCTAPNIEKTGYGTPLVFDAHKIIDENYLFMPIGVAKELAIFVEAFENSHALNECNELP